MAIVLVVLPFVPSAGAFRGVSLLAARGLAPRGKGVCGRISMAGESKEWKAAQRVVQADGGNRANALRFWLESDYGVDLSAVTLKASPIWIRLRFWIGARRALCPKVPLGTISPCNRQLPMPG